MKRSNYSCKCSDLISRIQSLPSTLAKVADIAHRLLITAQPWIWTSRKITHCVASVLLNAFQFESKISSSSSCDGAQRSVFKKSKFCTSRQSRHTKIHFSQVSKINTRATPHLLQKLWNLQRNTPSSMRKHFLNHPKHLCLIHQWTQLGHPLDLPRSGCEVKRAEKKTNKSIDKKAPSVKHVKHFKHFKHLKIKHVKNWEDLSGS